ncbi:MAG: hypothetical protein ACR2MP_18410 [Streptosporangiaceae bacterium]
MILTEGLFLLVTALARHGGTQLLTRLDGHSTLATTMSPARPATRSTTCPHIWPSRPPSRPGIPPSCSPRCWAPTPAP